MKKLTIRFTKKYFYDTFGSNKKHIAGLWDEMSNLRTSGKLIFPEPEAYYWMFKYPEYFEIEL